MENPKREKMGGTTRGITEQKRREEKLAEAKKEAEAWADGGGVQSYFGIVFPTRSSTPKGEKLEVRTCREEARGGGEPLRAASEGPKGCVPEAWGHWGGRLAVTRRAAEEMGGSIEVETEKGEGSRFTVRLPLSDGGDDSGSESSGGRGNSGDSDRLSGE